ncbi:unnamed protein product [Paramecium octaurelia]|uniref:ER lumen protein retaining receptor n=1 Tax=Paramecium octaurelia TaxID=43137 RepID=A0A8S1XS54_PAROT|nr:unnamed protein product [Paramecium octaurelia]
MDLILIIFTLGYLVQHAGAYFLIKYIYEKKNIIGLALETQVMYFIGAVMRILYISDTRLLSFFLIWIELVISIVLSAFIFYLFHKYRHTRFHQISNPYVSYQTIIPICLVLSFFFHPGTKNENYFTVQMFVSMSMFIEACGLLPQIYVSKKIGSIEADISKYLVAMGFSRLLRLVFWVMNYMAGEKFVYLILADVIHTVIIADIMFIWIRDKKKGAILI